MNLNIYYLQNDTGKLLLQNLQNELQMVTYTETQISSLDYLAIKIIDKETASYRVLNSPQTIADCNDDDYISSILEINRVDFFNQKKDIMIRSYDILICDLACISIRVSSHTKAKQKKQYIKVSENKKVVEIARRAAYVLGLDIAMVRVALTGKRRYKLTGIDDSPILRKRDTSLVANIIKRLYTSDKSIDKDTVKLGADPEFMLFNKRNNRMLSASQFFPREGVVGCDYIRIANRQQRPIAEIRPKPDVSPLGLMANIRSGLRSAYKMAPYRNVKWIAGSQPVSSFSIGGHIHFSNVDLNYDILRALDNYVGIPVFLIENPTTAARRRKKYGYLGDYRTKDYGGFEYRTPGSWLVSPEITLAILCLAKVVTTRYYQLPKKYLHTVNAQKAFYAGDQDYFRGVFEEIWDNIKKTDLYREYEEQLQIIPDMIRKEICWDEDSDFSELWKINTYYRKRRKKKPSDNPVLGNTHRTYNSSRTSNHLRVRRTNRSLNESPTARTPARNSAGSIPSSSENTDRGNYPAPIGYIVSPDQIRRSYAL